MFDDIFFIINDNEEFEYWVKDKCITNCFSLEGEAAKLMAQLAEFSNIPVYKKYSINEINKIIRK